MDALIFAIIPFLVTGLTSLTKRIPVFDISDPAVRTAVVRAIAAVFAFLGVSFVYMFGGDPITQTSVEELVIALLTLFAAIGGHEVLKGK